VALVTTTLLASAVWATGDVSKGKGIFLTTRTNRHSTEVGVNKVGPSRSVVGRAAAIVPDFT
jgi:cytochrome c